MSSGNNPAEKSYVQQATEAATNIKDSVANSLGGAKEETQPTVGSKLNDAWNSVKDATGIAVDDGAAKTEETKRTLGEQKDSAAVKAEEAKAGTAAAAQDAREDATRKAEEAKATASGVTKDARENLAEKIAPKK